MRSLIPVLWILVLTGCSGMQVLDTAKSLVTGKSDGKSLEVQTELTVGDKAEDNDNEYQLGDKNDQRQEAGSISNVITNHNIDKLMLLLLILGWVLPTPMSMLKWIGSKIPWVGGK